MMTTDRRTFLRFLSSAALTAALPQSIERALAIPAHHRTGTIEDVEHIVFLMQENRSFDHYFGTLRGVRGFGDPRPVSLPSGSRCGTSPTATATSCRFVPARANLGLQFLEDTPHGWTDTHAAWNGGKYDQWVPNKGRTTMAYLTRRDIPFHYALADAFTICDAYHCSLLGPTDPNRYHMWTGWVGNDGPGGGPVLNNAEAGYDWTTYPERLEQAGISWKIYQDIGEGLDAAGFWGWTDDPYIGNYGDNSLLYFHQYQNALPGQPLYEKARTGTNIAVSGTLFDVLREDVRQNKLPQVSWIVAPEAFSEHPNWPANYGAWYVSQVLDALTSNPEVWSKTALFITYDENDGFFDHLVPPTPPRSAAEGRSTVDAEQRDLSRQPRESERPVRPRRPRADDRRLAVEQGRLGLLGGVRPHLAHPVHRAALCAGQSRADRAEHHAVAPRRLRRSHLGVRLRDAQRRPGRVAGHGAPTSRRTTTAPGLRSGSADGSGVALAGTRASARPRAAVRTARRPERPISRIVRSGSTSPIPARPVHASRCAQATPRTDHGPTRSRRGSRCPTPGLWRQAIRANTIFPFTDRTVFCAASAAALPLVPRPISTLTADTTSTTAISYWSSPIAGPLPAG